jgi:DNA-binding MarR family transcriptional regulator
MGRKRANPAAGQLGGIDRVVHEPARLVIMANLYVVESADYTYLMNRTGLTWGNLSAHLSKLEEAGYVHIEKEFVEKKPHTMVRLTEEGGKAFELYRSQMQMMLSTDLGKNL